MASTLNTTPMDREQRLRRSIHLWGPLFFFEGYLLFTVLLFIFGPWPWPVPNPGVLYAYLGLMQVALAIGYTLGVRGFRPSYGGIVSASSLIYVSLAANVVWLLPKLYLRTGLSAEMRAGVAQAILTGVQNPAEAYLAKADMVTQVQGNPTLTLASLIAWPLVWLLLPLVIVNWKNTPLWIRCAVIVLQFIDILIWISVGTNKGISDLAIIVPWMLLVRDPTIVSRLRAKRLIRLVGWFVALGLVALIYFGWTQSSRRYGRELEKDNRVGINLNRDRFPMTVLPIPMQSAYGSLSSYLTQGYYALSLTMQEPFDWTGGVGNSFFLMGWAKHVGLPDDWEDRTYPAKIERYGLGRYERWHTAYAWWASDVSFPGTLIVMAVVGMLLARTWLDASVARNPFAVPLFALMVMMMYYLPANNQVPAFSASAAPFFVLLPTWLLTRRRFRGVGRSGART